MIEIIPPFTYSADHEIPAAASNFDAMRKKYLSLQEGGAEIIEEIGSVSNAWGFILRVIYRPSLDGKILDARNIFISWGHEGGPLNFVVSPLDDEQGLRESLRGFDQASN